MKSLRFATAVALSALGIASAARAANTTPVTTYNYGMTAFVEDPAQRIIYATVPSLNAVAVINAATLKVTTTIFTGSNPSGLDLSPDGSTLYVANNGANSIAVVNTKTLTASTPIALGAGKTPVDVQYGNNSRLWVLTTGSISQINASTGASTGPDLAQNGSMFPLLIGGGDIRISPDKNTLYYGTYGGSPSYLYKYDVTGTTPVESNVIATGSNGEDLQLSHDGSKIVHADGSGNTSRYTDVLYNTKDFSSAGTLNTGAYPYSFAFSPDDIVGYAGEDFQTPNVQIYNLNTFLQTGTITASAAPTKLFVDDSAQYLFADVGNTTQVFATGRSVPEPASLSILVLGACGLMARRPRRV